MLDPQDESFDRRLATHLVSLYYRSGARTKVESIVSLLGLSVDTLLSVS